MDAPAAEWEIKGWAASGAPPAEVAASRTLLTRDGPRTYWQKRLGDHKATDLSQTPGDAAYDFAAVAIRLGKERDALLYRKGPWSSAPTGFLSSTLIRDSTLYVVIRTFRT